MFFSIMFTFQLLICVFCKFLQFYCDFFVFGLIHDIIADRYDYNQCTYITTIWYKNKKTI